VLEDEGDWHTLLMQGEPPEPTIQRMRSDDVTGRTVCTQADEWYSVSLGRLGRFFERPDGQESDERTA
jgi:hypothetical protein